MLPMDKPALAKKIREAFDDNVYPGDDNIFDGIYDPDIDSWKELLLGISWDEALSKLEALVGSDQNYYDSMAFFMTAEALYYYTPMYLLLTIDTNSEVMGDGFMFQLHPEQNSSVVSLYSTDQKQIIALILQHYYREMDEVVDEALTKFWFQFLPA